MWIGILTPLAGIAPKRYFQEWSNTVMLLALGLSEKGIMVSMFRSQDFDQAAKTSGIMINMGGAAAEEQPVVGGWKVMPIADMFEHGSEFSLLHNFSGSLPLTYLKVTGTPVLSTICEVSPQDFPVWKKYDKQAFFTLPSRSGKLPELNYLGEVPPGLNLREYAFNAQPEDYVAFCDDIRPETGAREAVQLALKSGTSLIMSGKIENSMFFQKEIKPHLNSGLVTYLGEISQAKQRDLLARAYALFYPVKFNEVFPFRVIEAMAMGTPVISFRQGSLPEIITEEVTGFMVSSIQEAAGILPQVKKLNREDCRRAAEEKFSMEKMVDGYVKLYEQIMEERKSEDRRPWGYYRVICDEADLKVKRIYVAPGQRLSLQRHQKRSEHWYVTRGEAQVTLEDKDFSLQTGQAIDIPVGQWHRLANRGSYELELLEIQTGEYFGEDDIERREDDYARA